MFPPWVITPDQVDGGMSLGVQQTGQQRVLLLMSGALRVIDGVLDDANDDAASIMVPVAGSGTSNFMPSMPTMRSPPKVAPGV